MFDERYLGELVDELTVGHVGSMAAQYIDDGVPFLRSLNIQPYRISTDDIRYISNDFHRRLKKSALKPGDVVIVRTGKPGTCAVVPEWLENANCSDLVIVRCGPHLRPRYLAYWVNSLASHHIGSSLVGAVQQHFNVGAARMMPILLPSLGEQDAILAVLGSLDDKMELNRRMNETLDALAQAIFRDWIVDFGPVKRKLAGVSGAGRSDAVAILGGLIADPVEAARIGTLFPSTMGGDGLPEGWENSPFSRQIEILGGGTPNTSRPEYWDGVIPWFSVADTPNGNDTFVFETEKTITEQGLANSSAKLVEAGTTIITARGTVGNLALAGREMTFNQSCYALRARDGESPYYVYLSTKRIIQRLQSMAHGSVFSTITRHTFENVEAPLPPRPIRDAFEGLAAALFDRIKASVQENRTLAETRDYLLPKLMSGAVRVRDAEKAVS